MRFNARHSVTDGLDHLATRLDPIITTRLESHLRGVPWTAVLEQLDQLAGRPAAHYAQSDLQAQLKMLTTKLGQLGYPFDDRRRMVSTLGSELRLVRNSWAHGDAVTKLEAWRAHDYCVRLLEHFGDAEGLVRANEFRQEAFLAYVDEVGIAPRPTPEPPLDEDTDTAEPDAASEVESELVSPDPHVFDRDTPGNTPLVGDVRLSFQAWEPVPFGDVAELDALPKMSAKKKVRAAAAEIVEAEGPIHLDRLAQLIAASFGVRRLHQSRAKKITYQVGASGLFIDKAKFVWPTTITPDHWTEFRPNTSEADRPFRFISPTEIANAMRFLVRTQGLSGVELEVATLRTFGRRRRTQQVTSHLAKAKALI